MIGCIHHTTTQLPIIYLWLALLDIVAFMWLCMSYHLLSEKYRKLIASGGLYPPDSLLLRFTTEMSDPIFINC